MLGADVKDIRAGGSTPPDIWEILQGSGEGKPTALSRDLGNAPQGWEDPEWVLQQVGTPDCRYASKEGHAG